MNSESDIKRAGFKKTASAGHWRNRGLRVCHVVDTHVPRKDREEAERRKRGHGGERNRGREEERNGLCKVVAYIANHWPLIVLCVNYYCSQLPCDHIHILSHTVY